MTQIALAAETVLAQVGEVGEELQSTVILSVSQPSQPVVVATLPEVGRVLDQKLDGDWAFRLAGDRLDRFDLAGNDLPAPAGNQEIWPQAYSGKIVLGQEEVFVSMPDRMIITPLNAFGFGEPRISVVMAGGSLAKTADRLWTGTSPGLRSYVVLDPLVPGYQVELPQFCMDVAAIAGRAMLMDNTGLWIMQQDEDNWRIHHKLLIEPGCRYADGSGHLLAILTGDEVVVIDAGDPLAPIECCRVETEMAFIDGVRFRGDLLIVYGDGLRIVILDDGEVSQVVEPDYFGVVRGADFLRDHVVTTDSNSLRLHALVDGVLHLLDERDDGWNFGPLCASEDQLVYRVDDSLRVAELSRDAASIVDLNPHPIEWIYDLDGDGRTFAAVVPAPAGYMLQYMELDDEATLGVTAECPLPENARGIDLEGCWIRVATTSSGLLSYRLDEDAGLLEPVSGDPGSFHLFPAAPNPFNPMTTPRVLLERPGQLQLELFDVLGRRIREVYDGPLPAGVSRLQLSGSGLVSGSYFLHARMGQEEQVRSILLLEWILMSTNADKHVPLTRPASRPRMVD